MAPGASVDQAPMGAAWTAGELGPGMPVSCLPVAVLVVVFSKHAV